MAARPALAAGPAHQQGWPFTPFPEDLLMTTALTGGQWLACIGWSLIIPVVVEAEKAVRRRRHVTAVAPLQPAAAIAPARAR